MAIYRLKLIQTPVMQVTWEIRKSTSCYCTYVGGNMVTWRNKKQNVISRSNVEAKDKSMVQIACEMV